MTQKVEDISRNLNDTSPKLRNMSQDLILIQSILEIQDGVRERAR